MTSSSQPIAFGSKQLEHFRASKQRLPLHPLEKAVLTAVAVHLCFLPWALGTMHPWSQITSLVLSSLGLLIALIPRNYTSDLSGGPAFRLHPWARLVRFPIFWIGLALLAYIAVQGFNPSWVWERNETSWWLRRVNDIEWLPTSIDTPFERFNLWRQFIIYASAWLTLCTIWVGFTRRRALELLLITLSLNGTILATAGFIRMIAIPESNWVLLLNAPLYGATPFATFIYKNHASAYLALIASICLMLACVTHQRSIRSMARSDPTLIWLLGFCGLGFAVFSTYSRGAILLLAAYVIISLITYFLRSRSAEASANSRILGFALLGIIVLGILSYAATQLNYQRTTSSIASLIENPGKDASVAARLEAYEAGRSMLNDYWLRGVGAGGFRYLFPEYAKHHPAIYNGGKYFWEHLHRDWIQVFIELGMVGVALLTAAAAWLTTRLYRLHFWRQPALFTLLLGCIQPLLQAWFDFPFQNPAVLCTWLTLIAVSARWLELEAN